MSSTPARGSSAHASEAALPSAARPGCRWTQIPGIYGAKVTGIARGVSREPVPNRLLNYVAPTTDWIRLKRRFPVTLTLVDPPPDLRLYMGADARVVVLP